MKAVAHSSSSSSSVGRTKLGEDVAEGVNVDIVEDLGQDGGDRAGTGVDADAPLAAGGSV